MHIKEFDYQLPSALIAQYPIEKRDRSRLMVLHRKSKAIEHRCFFEITDYLKSEDVLILNDTKVIPARLMGKKQSGGKIEVLLLRPEETGALTNQLGSALLTAAKNLNPAQR